MPRNGGVGCSCTQYSPAAGPAFYVAYDDDAEKVIAGPFPTQLDAEIAKHEHMLLNHPSSPLRVVSCI